MRINGDYTKKDLNDFQKNLFLSYEMNSANKRVEGCAKLLDSMMEKNKNIRILDIGGGAGYFAMALHKKLVNAEVVVLEITEHNTWDTFKEIKFVSGNAFEAENLFEHGSFDIIFVNYVFHHLVQPTYGKTVEGIQFLLSSIQKLLKDEGVLFISECSYHIPVLNQFTGYLIYIASTIRVPVIAWLMRKLGSKSAGVGVCFLTYEKWLSLFQQTGYIVQSTTKNTPRTLLLVLRERFFNFALEKS